MSMMAEEPPAEMVGATQAPLTLAASPTTVHIAIGEPTGPARQSVTGGSPPRRAYLNLENITSSGVPSSYALYLNLPDGADPKQNRQLFAGLLPSFGVAEASRKDEHNSGGGLHHALDVTPIIEWLDAHGQWNPNDLRLTFVPRGEGAGAIPVQVGRASLFYK